MPVHGPASSTQTLTSASSLRRLASTLPADPAPTIT